MASKAAESKALLKKLFPDLSDALAHLCLKAVDAEDPYLVLARALLERSPHKSSQNVFHLLTIADALGGPEKVSELIQQKLKEPIETKTVPNVTQPTTAPPPSSSVATVPSLSSSLSSSLLAPAPVPEIQPAQLPLYFKSPYHEHHLLLYPRVYNGSYTCNECHQAGEDWVYHCSTCLYDCHPKCAQMNFSTQLFPDKLYGPLTKSGLVNRAVNGLATSSLPAEAHSTNASLYGPQNAFDCNADSLWVSVTSGKRFPFPHHLTYYYPDGKRFLITEYAIAGHPYDALSGQNPSAWTLSASNDNHNWVVLDRQQQQKFTPRTLNVYPIANAEKFGPFGAYRLSFQANSGWTTAEVVAVGQVEFRGPPSV